MILDVTPTPPTPSKAELQRQLRSFLAGVGKGRGAPAVDSQLSSTALHLLVGLPAAREAVLEYFSLLLDGMVSRHTEPGCGSEEEEVLLELELKLFWLEVLGDKEDMLE